MRFFKLPPNVGCMRRWGGRSMSLSTDKDMPGAGQALTATSETPMAYYTVLVAGGCFALLFKIGQTFDWPFFTACN